VKTYCTFYLVLVSVFMLAFCVPPAYAAPSQQAEDPVDQCSEGFELFIDHKNKEALPLLEAGFNGRDKANFANLEDLGYCALALGVLNRSIGNIDRALEAYQVALRIFQTTQNRVVVGVILGNHGEIFSHQGKYAQALDYYQQALAISQEVGYRAGEGTALNGIGFVYYSQGQYELAIDYYEQALAINRDMSDRAGESVTLNNIGLVYNDQGYYREALKYYQQALVIAREVGNRAGEGATLDNIGEAYRGQGQFEQALEYYLLALAILQEIGDLPNEGVALNNLGLVYYSQGQYEKALDYFQQALAIEREAGNRAGEGITLDNLGLIYYSQGQYENALDYYQQALAIEREVGNRGGEGITLDNLGMAYRAQGEYALAFDYFQQALVVSREVSDLFGEALSLNHLGDDFHYQGQYEQALDYYQQALAIVKVSGNRVGEGRTLNNIGSVYAAQSQYPEALDYYQQSIVVFEELRAIAGNDAARASFIGQYTVVYKNAAYTAHQLQQDQQAFAFSEQGRARSFLDAITTGTVELSDQPAAELVAREQEAYAIWIASQDALSLAETQSPLDPTLISALDTQIADAKQTHIEALQAIEARGDELSALVPGRSTVLSLGEVQNLLDDQTTLVSYFIIDDNSGALAFIITHNSFSVVELPNATPSNLKTAVEELLPSLQDIHPQPLQDLYAWLVSPITEQIKTPRVGIIPHLSLHYVPFAALTDGQTYFGEQYQLFLLPSASSLRYIQQHAAQATNSGAVVFGDPATDQTELPILPYAAAEAGAVATTLGVSNYTGSAATELRLRESVGDVAILHLAAHGEYNQYNPLYSTLYLAPDADGQYDGRLEVHEIFGLNLKGSQLVVLSACETQLGQLSTGDEVVGMTRAFMFAGAPSVLASLWRVDDEATQTLMTAFYKHWREDGMNKAQALQAAQADVRANPKWESPYYWAGFVLSGNVGVTSFQPASELVTEPASPPPSPVCPSAMLTPIVFIFGVFTFKRLPLHRGVR